MKQIIWKNEANAMFNGDFFYIQTYSGYSLSMIDQNATESVLIATATNTDLGIAIIKSLEQSRFLPLEEARFLSLKIQQNYQNWIEQKKEQLGYKTKNALFRKMMSCSIELDNEIITIRPSNHVKLEAWSGDGIDVNDYVHISAHSDPSEIGAALKLAFKRCRGAKPDEYKE